MQHEKLTLETAKKILETNIQNTNLKRHCISVGKVLSRFYDFYKKNNQDTGSMTKEEWEICGLLHDADWEKTKDNPNKHTLELIDWLSKYDVSQEMINVFKTHNNKITNLKNPETLIEWTLECCDELTGFIVSCALVTPEKKLSNVEVSSVLKKFKQKEFSRAVDRNQIEQCNEKLGIPIEIFVEETLNSMKQNSDLLGL